jgi:NADPH:quinone reductase-like Zn-dependent oxidoreductase
MVGGPYMADNLQAMAPLGRMVIVAIMGGDAEPMPLRHLMGKRLSVRGTMLRARPLEEKIAATRLFDEQVNPLLADGRVRPIVDKVYALDQVAEAHRYLEANESFGKVILSLD